MCTLKCEFEWTKCTLECTKCTLVYNVYAKVYVRVECKVYQVRVYQVYVNVQCVR